MTEPAPTLLDYASADLPREPWGPVFFRPSRLSLVLLALTTLGAAWLGLRHEPWRRVGGIDDQSGGLWFTHDGRILALGLVYGANLYDPRSATIVRNVLPRVDLNTYRYFMVAGGERILALPYADDAALLYNTESGRIVQRLPNPDGLGSRLVAIAPDGPRIVTYWIGGRGRGPGDRYLGWHLGGTDAATGPAQLLNQIKFRPLEFSPNGQWLLNYDRFGAGGFELFDGVTFKLIQRQSPAAAGAMLGAGFADGERLWVVHVDPAADGTSPKLILQTLSCLTGETIGEVELGLNGVPIRSLRGVMVSDDLRWVALAHYGPAGEPMLDLFDARSGHRVRRQTYRYTQPIRFFPHSDRLLVSTPRGADLAVIDVQHAQPLAILRGEAPGMFAAEPQVAPDGRTILSPLGAIGLPVGVYRETGWDCPQSPLGALAFWPTWLTTGAFVALVACLWRDARGARREAGLNRVHGVIAAGLIVVGTVLTLHLLLNACLGRWLWTPAPLLLACGLGLDMRSRFWRLGALVLLASLLPLDVYLGYGVQRRGLEFSTAFEALDRIYEVPNMAPYVALAGAAALTIVALPLLARRSAEGR